MMPTPVGNDTDLINNFVEDCKLRGITEESTVRYKSTVSIFSNFLRKKNKSVLNIDKNILRDFIAYIQKDKKLSHKTLENYFSALSSFYEYLTYEEMVKNNPVLPVRKRYLRVYKEDSRPDGERQCPSVEDVSGFINSIANIRDKAIATLLAKTGIRRGELISSDVDDIKWKNQSIKLKPTAKRSNRIVFFDDECARVLEAWLRTRNKIAPKNCKALFVNNAGERLDRNGLYKNFNKWAVRYGLHNPKSDRIEEHFSPHCLRHWFTTHLVRNGMRREYIKELRGDARKDAMDIYNHIDLEDLRKAYLACIPLLGI